MEIRLGVLLLALATTIWATNAWGVPILSASDGKTIVTVYDEECKLKDLVTNLPGRATWTENGKTNEGCAAYRPDLGIVIFWFDDKTVAVAPASAFRRVTGT